MVFDSDRVARWVFERLPSAKDSTDYQAIGLERGGKLVAGFVVNQFDGSDAQLTVAALPGALWARTKYLRALAHYVFEQLKCSRVSVSVNHDNAKSLRAAERFGFVREGIKRPDIVMLGMLREECRFL